MSLTAPLRLRVEKPKIRLRVLPKLIPLDGKSVEMQTTADYIQWRLVGDTAWTNLIALSEIAGPKGDDGSPGPANSLSIGTVESGTDAAATITGDAPDQTLNLTLPKGDKGADADIAADTHAATSKATPVDADELPLVDSAASNVLKKLTWANVKATLKAYTDTLYLSKTLARREVLTANRAYYVATTGSDSNDGLTSGTAFLTIQKAANVAATLDLSGFSVTINVGAGTFASPSLTSLTGGSAFISGAGSTTILDGRISADGIIGRWNAVNVKIQSTQFAAVYARQGAIYFGAGIEFGTCTGAQCYALADGYIQFNNSYAISGGGTYHLRADGGAIFAEGITVTLTGTPTFSGAFAIAQNTGQLYVGGNTYSGSATGIRYNVSAVSVIRTYGAGASYLPGDTAGVTSTGGQYV